jgi:hypothetical protein
MTDTTTKIEVDNISEVLNAVSESPPATPETVLDIMRQVGEMDQDDRTVVVEMMRVIVSSVKSGEGTAILMSDEKGDGRAIVVAIGNALLVGPLLATAGAVGQKVLAQPTGPVQ